MSWHKNLEENSPAYLFAASDENTIRSVAGPGSGKSFAIGRKIARLIEGGMDPKDILAITFTRTAARDLRHDISNLDVEGSENVLAHTVHSHALSILMQANVIEQTGRNPRMILDHEISPALRDLSDPKFGGVENKKLLLDAYLAAWATLQTDEAGFVKDEIEQAFEEEVVNWMRKHGGMHVGEVIPVAINYLRYNPASPAIGKYHVVLIDEYQDLNKGEQEFINLIRGKAQLVVVGDDDQSIYGFKFAHPEGIRTVDQLHGQYADVPFEQCRRCPTHVTELASVLIGNNPNRTLDDLVPFSENAEGIIDLVQWPSVDDEIAGIPEIIKKEIDDGNVAPEDVLVLTPRRIIGYALRDQLAELAVRARSYFRESSIKKLEAQIAYSIIALSADPNDPISLRFLVGANSPNYRAPQYKRVCDRAEADNCSVVDIFDQLASGAISIQHVTTIVEAYRNVRARTEQAKQALKTDPANLFINVFSEDEELPDSLRELSDLYSSTLEACDPFDAAGDGDFDTWLKEFVTQFQADVTNPTIPEDIDHVRVMSLHSSKGLSAKFVLVCSQIEELIPGKDKTDAHVQEQRRLFYVAVTRCKASKEYPGRLVVSSFLSLSGQDALTMGIPARVDQQRKVRTTRYLKEFGPTAPAPKTGQSLI